MGLAVLQGLSLLLRLVLQVVPLLQAAQHQAVEDVLVGLLDQLLKQPQRHDADLGTEGMRLSSRATKSFARCQRSRQRLLKHQRDDSSLFYVVRMCALALPDTN